MFQYHEHIFSQFCLNIEDLGYNLQLYGIYEDAYGRISKV